ncbi:hypothetical protein FRB95_001910 [Tulasnella sp. JGI-2019a]|nr:hypothetical protein FRB95_001910 [Tulasnella sp. JGI-2019a]
MALSDSDATSTCGGLCKWPEEDLKFTGTNGPAECGRFISAIRKHAYLHGKQRDDEWITDLVATCLSGIALTWHVMLPSQIAWHWGSLQQALVERFVLVSEGAAEGSTPSLMPTKTIQPRIFPRTSGLRAFVTESA